MFSKVQGGDNSKVRGKHERKYTLSEVKSIIYAFKIQNLIGICIT